jgi:hypothetical protein
MKLLLHCESFIKLDATNRFEILGSNQNRREIDVNGVGKFVALRM